MKNLLRKIGIRWHSQNLKEDRPRRWFNQRGWVHFGERCFSWQLVLGAWTCSAEIRRDDEGVHGILALPPVAFYFGYEGKRYVAYRDRELSLSVHGGTIWWNLWTPSMEWDSRTPRWRNGNFNPADFLLGRRQFAKHVLGKHDTFIPMPEGCYPATVELRRDTWKRRRSPFTSTMLRANVDIPGGIPHDGKGENSWDCGEDGLFGMTCPAATVEAAVAACVESVLRDRRRYGGTRPPDRILNSKSTAA